MLRFILLALFDNAVFTIDTRTVIGNRTWCVHNPLLQESVCGLERRRPSEYFLALVPSASSYLHLLENMAIQQYRGPHWENTWHFPWRFYGIPWDFRVKSVQFLCYMGKNMKLHGYSMESRRGSMKSHGVFICFWPRGMKDYMECFTWNFHGKLYVFSCGV